MSVVNAPDEAAQDLLLERDPLRLVQAQQLRQLSRVDVVVALLDDHDDAIPPSAQYLSSSHSSIP